MKKPNITKAEFIAYIKGAADAFTKSITALVAKGKIKQAEADAYIKKHLPKITAIQNIFANGWPADAATPTFLLGIRGYYLNSQGKAGENDRGIYDDAFVLVGPGYFKTFNANTDPRKIGFGIGTLLPGVHDLKQGPHPITKPNVPAFRTADVSQVLPGTRDGQIGIKDLLGVNLHPGGTYNVNSIACQTVQAQQWPEFKTDAYKLTDKTKKILTYLLTEQVSY